MELEQVKPDTDLQLEVLLEEKVELEMSVISAQAAELAACNEKDELLARVDKLETMLGKSNERLAKSNERLAQEQDAHARTKTEMATQRSSRPATSKAPKDTLEIKLRLSGKLAEQFRAVTDAHDWPMNSTAVMLIRRGYLAMVAAGEME